MVEQIKEVFIIGTTDSVKAEYGYETDKAWTMLTMYGDDVLVWEGYNTYSEALAVAKTSDGTIEII